MGSNELHKPAAEPVRNVGDEPVLVAAQIENQAIIGDEIDSRAELPLDVVRSVPARLTDNCEPDTDRSLSSRVAPPELLQSPTRDHLHDGINIMSPIW